MARKSSRDTLEEKIEQAQQRVIKTKAAYDKAVDDLQILIDKKKAMETDELMNAIAQSGRSFEEIMRFLEEKQDDLGVKS